MPITKQYPKRQPLVQANGQSTKDDDRVAEERTGTGPYVVVADYRTLHGNDPCSRVLKQFETRVAAIKLAAGAAARMRTHTRVELWPRGDGRRTTETILREFGGPSVALTAFDADHSQDEGVERGKRLPPHERDRRARAVLRVLAECPMQTDTVAGRLGYGRSGLNGVLAWGEKVGLWVRSRYTNRWSLTAAGQAAAAGGPLP